MNEELMMLNKFEEDTLWLHKNLDRLRAKFENKFVAVKNAEVIASGDDVDGVITKLKENSLNPAFVVIEFIHKKGIQLIL